MHRKQGRCTVWWRPVWWRNTEMFKTNRSNGASLLRKKKKNRTVSVFFLCSSAFYHLCKKKTEHWQSVRTQRNHCWPLKIELNKMLEFLWQLWPMQIFNQGTSRSSSPGWKAPVVLRPMSAGFLRPPSPLRRPPEPLEDMELEELGSLGLLTVGNCGRL